MRYPFGIRFKPLDGFIQYLMRFEQFPMHRERVVQIGE